MKELSNSVIYLSFFYTFKALKESWELRKNINLYLNVIEIKKKKNINKI